MDEIISRRKPIFAVFGMKSWIVWLCQSSGEVSAEAKLLLAGVIRHYGDGAVRGVERSIGKPLGMSARVVSRELAELVAADHLVSVPASPAGKRGRPAMAYKVRPELLRHSPAVKLVAWGDKEEGGHFEALVETLLAEPSEELGGRVGPGQAPSREGAAKRLSASNRLLLLVLLGLADRNGVVRGWGPSELSRLAGLTAGQLAGQIRKLLALGYLRAAVPGVSGSRLFGRKPGVYFLNLSHPSYKGVVPEVVLVFPVEEVELYHRSQGNGRVIYRLTLQLGRQPPSGYIQGLMLSAGFADTGEVIKRLAPYFNGIGTSTLPEYFQMRLEAYATHMLSSGASLDDALMASQMREVMAREAFNCSEEDLRGGQRTYIHLAEYLARRQAELLRGAIDRIRLLAGRRWAALHLEGATYALVPAIASSGGLYIALCAMPASGRGDEATCIIAGRNAEHGTLREERHLSNEAMWDYGLLTRQLKRIPKRDPLVLREHLRAMASKILSDDGS